MFGQAVYKQNYSQEKGSRSKWSTLNNIICMYSNLQLQREAFIEMTINAPTHSMVF